MNDQMPSLLRDSAMSIPATFFKSYVSLCQTRSQAIADYWRALSGARRPEDVLEAQFDFWTHLLRDYATAGTNGIAEGAAEVERAATAAKEQVRPAA